MAKEDDNKFELPEELGGFIGVEAEDFDGFKKAFNEKFIPRDKAKEDDELASSIIGERMGALERALKRQFKDTGIDLTVEDGKEKKVEDLTKTWLTRLVEAHGNKVKELEDASGKGNDEQIKDLQEKLKAAEEGSKKKASELQSLLDDTKSKYEELQKTHKDQLTGMTLKALTDSVDRNTEWATEVDYFKERKSAFDADFNANFKKQLNDDQTAIIVTDSDGNRIKDSDKAGEFISFEKLYRKKAQEAGLLKINDKGGKPAPKPGAAPPAPAAGGQPPVPGANGRQDDRKINLAGRE